MGDLEVRTDFVRSVCRLASTWDVVMNARHWPSTSPVARALANRPARRCIRVGEWRCVTGVCDGIQPALMSVSPRVDRELNSQGIGAEVSLVGGCASVRLAFRSSALVRFTDFNVPRDGWQSSNLNHI
jgi:hypothetical protein